MPTLFRPLFVGPLVFSLMTITPGKIAAGSKSLNSTATLVTFSSVGYTESIVFNVDVDQKENCKVHSGRINFKTVVKSPQGIDQIRDGYQTWSNVTEKRFTVQWTGYGVEEKETLTKIIDVQTDSVCVEG
jgi:hypothetical protein